MLTADESLRLGLHLTVITEGLEACYITPNINKKWMSWNRKVRKVGWRVVQCIRLYLTHTVFHTFGSVTLGARLGQSSRDLGGGPATCLTWPTALFGNTAAFYGRKCNCRWPPQHYTLLNSKVTSPVSFVFFILPQRFLDVYCFRASNWHFLLLVSLFCTFVLTKSSRVTSCKSLYK